MEVPRNAIAGGACEGQTNTDEQDMAALRLLPNCIALCGITTVKATERYPFNPKWFAQGVTGTSKMSSDHH